MLALTYAEIVSTLALLVAAFSVGWQWWVRRTAPDEAVRAHAKLRSWNEQLELLPKIRSHALNVIHAIEAVEEIPDPMRLRKLETRIGTTLPDWDRAERTTTGDVAEAIVAADLRGAHGKVKDWVRADSSVDEGVMEAIVDLRERLQNVVDTIEAG